MRRCAPWLACGKRVSAVLRSYAGEIPEGSHVLDIGCGNGALGRAVAAEFGAIVEGCDVANLLELDLPFRLIENDLPYCDATFDIAMINDALHHIPRQEQGRSLCEAMRVANKVLIFETYPTLIAKVADLIMACALYRNQEAVPLSHRRPDDWADLISGLGWHATWREVSVPRLYPLRHFAISVRR